MDRTHAPRRRRKGLTLIEAGMVLAILAMVTAGTVLAYSKASMAQGIDDANAQVSAMLKAIRNVYAGQSGYGALSVSHFYDQMPARMRTGGALRTNWGGAVAVAPYTAFTANDSVSITFPAVPFEACMNFALRQYGSDFMAVSFGGTTYNFAQGQRVTPAAARAGCSTAGGRSSFAWVAG